MIMHEQRKHTPGPWVVGDNGVRVYAPDSDTIINDPNDWSFPDWDEAEANARLIAAAPELLEVLNALISAAATIDFRLDVEAEEANSRHTDVYCCGAIHHQFKERIAAARAAIKRATETEIDLKSGCLGE